VSKNILSETLSQIQFLRDMAPEHLEQIADVAGIIDFEENDTVFREGDAAVNMFLIVSGTVSLEVCAAGAGCKQILTLGPGELVGWSSHLGQARYTARARTPCRTRLVRINVPELMKICDRDPRIGYELMRRTALALAKRLSATRIQFVNVYGEQLPVTGKEGEAR